MSAIQDYLNSPDYDPIQSRADPLIGFEPGQREDGFEPEDDPEEEVESVEYVERELDPELDGEERFVGEEPVVDEGGRAAVDGEEEVAVPTMITAGSVNLPPPPIFRPFEHPRPEHQRRVQLPPNFTHLDDCLNGEGQANPDETVNDEAQANQPTPLCPWSFFKLLFTEQVFGELARNTNAYAASKGAGTNPGGRPWRQTSAGELMIFVGLIIYMGVYKVMQVPQYWSKNRGFLIHEISTFMPLLRFQQLKGYFHIAPVTATPNWADKLQPLAGQLENAYKRYHVPCTNVSIDEMMARFTGRSCHTVLMRSKPIPKGYKMLALCDKGYTYAFMFASRIQSFANLKSNLELGLNPNQLSPTSGAVVQLMFQLPYRDNRFILFCDSYFSNIPPFTVLRQHGISACGAVRPNPAQCPRELKVVDKRKVSLPWNTVSGVVCGLVLAVLWQDKNLARFLTTAYECTPENHNYLMRDRGRPLINAANRHLIEVGWGNDPIRTLRVPKLSVKYNYHVGGADTADQRRGYYYTQLRTCRNWLALFLWLLDGTIINGFLIARDVIRTPSRSEGYWKHHGFFRVCLAWNSVMEGFRHVNPTYAASIHQSLAAARPQPYGTICKRYVTSPER